MNRFLMLLAVAAVAGGMYVAAAPGRSLHAGPTWRQFTALKKQVTTMKTDVKTLKSVAALDVAFFAACTKLAVPIDQYGDGQNQTEGYRYSHTPLGTNEILTTALDVAPSTDTGALWLTGGDATCGTLVNGTALRHAAAAAGIRLPHASARASFTAHRP